MERVSECHKVGGRLSDQSEQNGRRGIDTWRLNLACGPHVVEGYENLDQPRWRFEDGLPYDDGSVEAIHIGHALMFVQLDDWPFVFAEIARVLQPGGVVRITEDSTDDPESERYGGFHDAVTLTSVDLVRKHLKLAGLKTRVRDATSTGFTDDSLLQAHHGAPPKVFFVEGTKP